MAKNNSSYAGAAAASSAFQRAGTAGMGATCPPGEEDTILDYHDGKILVMRADAKYPETLLDLWDIAPHA